MIRLFEIRMEITENIEDLHKRCEKLLGCRLKRIKLVKRAIDARRKSDIFYSCTADCEPDGQIRPADRVKFRSVDNGEYTFPRLEPSGKIVVVGSGPAGLFSALMLARQGFCPTVLERGASVDDRTAAVERFFTEGKLDENTNIQFGEGGAGTFSDGKLNTGINDMRIKAVLKEFVRFGAPEDILIDAAPHIGTDILQSVVKNMRQEIISLGGRFLFNTVLSDIIVENGKLCGIKIKEIKSEDERDMECDALILAIGHSGRDTMRMLYKRGLKMEQKPFSVGVRIEHKQQLINDAMYGSFSKMLPPAPYKLWTHLEDGSSLYTFCMCPGGFVVNAASEHGGVVTNGMSNNAREGENANSALLVNVSNLSGGAVFAGMELQEKIEKKAFEAGGGGYLAPVQTLGDFLAGKPSSALGDVEPTIRPGYTPGSISDILPEGVCSVLRRGIVRLEKRLRGFCTPDAVLTAPETRSSSPVKVIRDRETLKTNIEGIFSAGEGGGHAGGITSSAVDGIRVAEAAGIFLSGRL